MNVIFDSAQRCETFYFVHLVVRMWWSLSAFVYHSKWIRQPHTRTHTCMSHRPRINAIDKKKTWIEWEMAKVNINFFPSGFSTALSANVQSLSQFVRPHSACSLELSPYAHNSNIYFIFILCSLVPFSPNSLLLSSCWWLKSNTKVPSFALPDYQCHGILWANFFLMRCPCDFIKYGLNFIFTIEINFCENKISTKSLLSVLKFKQNEMKSKWIG